MGLIPGYKHHDTCSRRTHVDPGRLQECWGIYISDHLAERDHAGVSDVVSLIGET